MQKKGIRKMLSSGELNPGLPRAVNQVFDKRKY